MRRVWQALMVAAFLGASSAGLLALVATYHIYIAGPASVTSSQMLDDPFHALVLSSVAILVATWLFLHARAKLMRRQTPK